MTELRATIRNVRFAMEVSAAKRRLRKGMKARVTDGTLAGKSGTIEWVRGAKAGLEAQLFGSMRVVEVPASALEAA
jgi:transcription antitermination factor NusG